ncbi:hypothetical protein G7046_g2535 [Stylonectria norvegica]|nr:hypothetical protein G7046_g2535 [Stylonectria norvegica]
MEANAITAMHDVPKSSSAKALWDFTLDFQKVPAKRDYLQLFPQIQVDLDEGAYKGEHEVAMRNLHDVAGHAFGHRGPGSSKSTLGTTICQSIMKTEHRIAWITPSNGIVQDAYDRLVEANPAKRTGRMLPWTAELNSLLTLPREAPVVPVSKAGSASDQEMATHVNKAVKSRFDTTMPSKIMLSMSHNARGIAEANPDAWADYHRGLVEFKLLTAAINSCDAIYATPVAFAQRMNHVARLGFKLIVSDETSQSTEATAWSWVSKCPDDVRHLFLGDNRQLGFFIVIFVGSTPETPTS